MITIPDDPVENMIQAVRHFGLTLMDEVVIITDRDMNYQPNDIQALGIGYEELDSHDAIEASMRKYIARQLRLSKESTYKRYFPAVALQVLKQAR